MQKLDEDQIDILSYLSSRVADISCLFADK